jgi:hypothetical protein
MSAFVRSRAAIMNGLGFMERFVAALRRRPLVGWVGLVVYAAAVTFPHEAVQRLVAVLASKITHKWLYAGSALLAIAEAALATVLILRRTSGRRGGRRLVVSWVAIMLLIVCTARWLTANNTELVHYPQYFPEGAALWALTMSPVETLAWVTVFGGLDEGYQYAVLSRGKPVPWDFNDIYMDLLGGAAGMVFAMAYWRRSKGAPGSLARPGLVLVMALVAAGIGLWCTGAMAIHADPDSRAWFTLSREKAGPFWFVDSRNGPNRYHTLAPWEGVALIGATIMVITRLAGNSNDGASRTSTE